MFSSSSSNIPRRFLFRRSLFVVATSSSANIFLLSDHRDNHFFRHHSDFADGILDAPPAPPSSNSNKKVNAAPPPPPSSASSSIGTAFSIPAPTSHKLNDLATTHCPLCNTQTHIKELLRHLNNDHPTQIQSGAIDRDVVRKLIRERYTMLHAAIKHVWANNSPKHAVADKSKGGYPCRHCVRDETGLHPLFPTVDSLMKHIGGAHEKDGIDVDDEEVPKRMSADDVNQIIEILKNGSNSGIVGSNPSSADLSVSSTNTVNNNNNNAVVGISVNDITSSIFQMSEGMNSSELPDAPSASSAMSSNQNFAPFPTSHHLAAFRCELCNKQTDREIDMLQHYDNAHADIVYNLGLSRKFTVRNFIDNDERNNLEQMGESSLFASSASSLPNKNDSDSASTSTSSTTCWVKAILAPSSGIPRVLIMPWNNYKNQNKKQESPFVQQQQDNLIREKEIAESRVDSPAASIANLSNSEESEIVNSLNEDENGVVDFSSSSLPPPPPRSSTSTSTAATKTTSVNVTNISSTSSAFASTTNVSPSTDHLANLLRCQHCGAKLKSAQSFEMHLKDKHKIVITDVRHQQEYQPLQNTENNNNRTGSCDDDCDSDVVKSSNSSVSFDDLLTRADLSNMKYYCTFGTCNRKQFLSRTAFQAHIEAKHGEVVPNFNVELEKILRNKYCTSIATTANSSSQDSETACSDNSVLSTSLTCNVCGKTGFSSYNAFANHLQDKHDIVIEKYSSGINTKSSSNIFVVSSSIFDSSTAASESVFNQKSGDNSDSSLQQGSSLNQETVAYECEHCGKSFTTFNGYDNHVRSKHHVAPTRLILKRSSTNSSIISSQQNNSQNDSNFQSSNFVSSAPPSFPSHIAAATTRNAAKLSHDANNNEGEDDAAWKTSSSAANNDQISENMENRRGIQGGSDNPSNNTIPIPFPPPPAAQCSAPPQPSVNFSQLKNAWWCNHCNRGFGTPQALQGHLMSKHGYRPSSAATTLACPVSGCRKVSADQFALVDHLKQAHRTTGEISDAELRKYDIGDGFACAECGKRFLVEPELNQHFALNHSGLQRRPANNNDNDSLNDGDDDDQGNGRQQGRRFNNNNKRRTGSANFRKRF